jgi:hypothetical protein
MGKLVSRASQRAFLSPKGKETDRLVPCRSRAMSHRNSGCLTALYHQPFCGTWPKTIRATGHCLMVSPYLSFKPLAIPLYPCPPGLLSYNRGVSRHEQGVGLRGGTGYNVLGRADSGTSGKVEVIHSGFWRISSNREEKNAGIIVSDRW